MSFGRRSRHSQGSGGGHDDLMMTPLLDLFVALIPFLIFSFVLQKIHVVDVGVSKPVASASAAQTQNFDLLLKVGVDVADLSLNGKSIKKVSKGSSQNWMAELRAALVEVKRRHPDEFRIRIEPQGKVALQSVMEVMDAARKLRPEDGDIITKDKSGQAVKLQFLFPNVVLRGVYS
jgi:biopolymer transport protein ExbD